MELKNQVVNLELSRKMKELGFEQESMFYWWTDSFGVNKDSAIALTELHDHKPHNPKEGWQYYSAYTVAELGEMVKKYRDGIEKIGNRDVPDELKLDGLSDFDGFMRLFDPDYWAKMLIYIKEQKLI